MKYFKKIAGEKIYLSPLNVDDYETYTKWMNDFNVTDGLNNSCALISLDSEKDWLQDNIKNGYQFAIVKEDTNQLLGNCSLFEINQIHRCATVGIFIGEERDKNNGYGTQALQLLIEYGFKYLNLNNIMLKVYSFNEIAIACYKKVGLKEFGRRRNCYYLNGNYYDEIHMDILYDEFPGNYIKNKNI